MTKIQELLFWWAYLTIQGLTPLPLPKFAEMILNEKAGEPCEALVDHLLARAVLTDAQLNELKRVTRQQSKSNAWFSQRIGRLTASCHFEMYQKLEQVLHHKRNVSITPILSKIMGSSNSLKTLPSIKWGEWKALIEHNWPYLHSFQPL